ncbi:MAG: class I SAM-dependent methyltransferase [Actinobacteria bacterium]|nr:class I SAM-dependent methyltransferase [Actinomycetota bacterium]
MSEEEAITQVEMIQRLPRAQVVDRVPFLVDAVRCRRAAHVGFVDAGCWQLHERLDRWIHAHLDRAAAHLIGVDIDAAGVERARSNGFEAYVADCRDGAALAALPVDPVEVVVAGEVIEHVDEPGPFLAGLRSLTESGGRLVLTTPNASGLLNSAAAVAGFEVNHPDHVVAFTWFTLSNLLERHGWTVRQVATYVPEVKDPKGLRGRDRVLAAGAGTLLALERLLGRFGRPFAADGLVVVAERR